MQELCGPVDPGSGYGTGWPQLGQAARTDNLYVVDALARILHTLRGGKSAGHPRSAVATAADPPDYVQLSYGRRRARCRRTATGTAGRSWAGGPSPAAVAHIKATLAAGPPPSK